MPADSAAERRAATSSGSVNRRLHTRPTAPLRRAMLTAAALLALAMTAGCIRADADLTINGVGSDDPETTSGTVLIAVEDEWALEHGQDPAAIGDALAEELAAATGSGVSGEPYARDGYTGATLHLDDVPLDRVAASTDGLVQIGREGQTYIVSGDLSAFEESLTQDDPLEVPPWSVTVSITMPADVTEHNGDLEGRTVSWTADQDSGDAQLQAISGVGDVPFLARIPVPLIALTALAAVGAGLAWWLGRRRSSDEAEPAGFRARQARARATSTTKLDDMLGGRRDRSTRENR